MSAADPRLARAVEIRLRHRLDDFSRDLERQAADSEAPGARAGASRGSSVLARDLLAAQSTALIEQHAARVLADLVAMLAEAGDPALHSWFVGRFDAHLEQVVERTLATLRDR